MPGGNQQFTVRSLAWDSIVSMVIRKLMLQTRLQLTAFITPFQIRRMVMVFFYVMPYWVVTLRENLLRDS